MPERLTTLENVKTWLELTGTSDDELLNALIDGASGMILGFINRDTLLSKQRTEPYNGFNSYQMVLHAWPVTQVAALAIDGVAIAVNPTPPVGAGYSVDLWDGSIPGAPSSIIVNGSCFTRGRRNIAVTYTAGYRVTDEAATIPSTEAYALTPAQASGTFAADIGVKFANTGASLTKVASAPIAGQYALDQDNQYVFAAADAGAAVLLSYSFIPPAVENACFELVGEQYRYRKRIGEVSRALQGGGSVTFSQKAMSDYVKQLLQPYMAVVPLWH